MLLYIYWEKISNLISRLELDPNLLPDIDKEYKQQIIGMRILLEAMFVIFICFYYFLFIFVLFNVFSTGFPRNMQRICELGGWAKLIDVILWVTLVYSIRPVLEEQNHNNSNNNNNNNSSPESSDNNDNIVGEIKQRKIVSRAPELKEIFDLLYFLCVGSLKHGDISKTGVNAEIDLNREIKISPHLNRHILTIIVDLFNKDIRNTKLAKYVRNKLITEYPELQTHVLEFIVGIIQRYRPAILLCTKDRLWDLLFSENFFFCGYEDGLFTGLQLKSEIVQKSLHQKKFFEKVHQQVLLFIKFTGALSGHNNIHECIKLVHLLDCYYYDSSLVHTICSTIDMFLQQNTEVTQQALSRIKALSILFDVIKNQQEIYFKLQKLNEEEEQQQQQQQQQQQAESHTNNGNNKQQINKFFDCFSLVSFMNSRLTSIQLLISFLNHNEEAKTLFIQNESMIETLLNLLFEAELRETCLRVIMLVMSPYRNSEKNRSLATLYSYYWRIFREAQDRTSNEDFNLLLMLLSGVRNLVSKFPKSRSLFRTSGAFLNITTALNTEERLNRLPELCIDVFKTILSLLSNSDKNKIHMQRDIGYDTLINLVLRALQCDNESKLLHHLTPLLFDLLVDGKFDIQTRYVIENPDIITFMFKLVLFLPDKQRNDMIDTFTSIVNKCPLNQSLCCEEQLIFCLLEMIPKINQNANLLQKFSSLIEVLGTHSITVKELKRQFLLLKSEPGDFRPRGQIRLMKALQFMALSRTIGPLTFFDFNGKSSSLELPPLEKWPRNNGYTFCLWIRAESLPESTTSSLLSSTTTTTTPSTKQQQQSQSSSDNPRIISFLDQEGYGLELYLCRGVKNFSSNYFLEISLSNTSNKSSIYRFSSQGFELHKWYFITISHSSQNKLRLKESELALYINGNFKEKASIRFPQFPNILNRVCIGSNFIVQGTGKRLPNCHYFHGQLGPFLLFDEAVSSNQSKFLFQKSNELVRSGTSCFGELENKIVLYYNSTARSGKKFLDLTPEKIRERRFDAIMKGKLYSCATPDIKDTIHCLGGVQVLFPIFAQLDQPEVPNLTTDDDSNAAKIDYSVDPNLILQAFALLGDMLFLSETNQKEMVRCHGFEVIGYLLEQSSPSHITSEFIVTLEDLTHKIQGYLPLEETFWQCIICRWSIWIYSDPKVQWELLKLLDQSIKNSPKQFRKTLGIQRLLDGLFFYYWYTTIDNVNSKHHSNNNNNNNNNNNSNNVNFDSQSVSSSSSLSYNYYLHCRKNEIFHPVTKKLIGRRPNKEELVSLRKFFFSSMGYMLQNGISEHETRAILSALYDTNDILQIVELLDFIYTLLQIDKIPHFSQNIQNMGGTTLFFKLLYHDHDDIVQRSLLIVCILIKINNINNIVSNPNTTITLTGGVVVGGGGGGGIPTITTQTTTQTTTATQNNSTSTSSSSSIQFDSSSYNQLTSDYLQISNILNHFNISIYNILYNILVGVQSITPTNIDDEHKIVEIKILSVILILIPLGNSFLKQKALQDIYILTIRYDKNCEIILQSNRWIIYLLDVYIEECKLDDNENSKIVKELCFNIFRSLLNYSDKSDHFSLHKILQQIILISSYYESRGILSQEIFLRNLYFRLLKSYRNDSSIPSTSSSSSVSNKQSSSNVNKNEQQQQQINDDHLLASQIKFIGILDQFFFYTPRPDHIKNIQQSQPQPNKKRQRNISITQPLPSSPSRNHDPPPPPPPSTQEIDSSPHSLSAPSLQSQQQQQNIKYSPLKGVTDMTLHMNGNHWDDLDLALLLFDILNRSKIFINISSSKIKMISKQAEKAHDIRTSIQMILIRISVNILRFGTISSCLETVPIIRELVRFDLSKKPTQRTNYILSHLLVTLKMIGLGKDAENVGKTKVILPFVKELILFSLSNFQSSILPYKTIFQTKRTYREFLNDYNQQAWLIVFNWGVQSSSAITIDEKSYCSVLDKFYTKAIQPVIHFIQQSDISRKKSSKKLKELFYQIQLHLLQNEKERKENIQQKHDEVILSTRRLWRNILRSLTNERGPWASNDENEKLFWKLDKTENFSRMRLKLKRNYHFDSHADAVKDDHALESTLDDDDVDQTKQQQQQQEETLKLFSGMKLIKSIGVGDDLDDEELQLLLSSDDQQQQQQLNVDSSDTSSSTSNNNLPSFINNPQEERIIYTTKCDLITPLQVTSGILEISNYKILFREKIKEDHHYYQNHQLHYHLIIMKEVKLIKIFKHKKNYLFL